ncbi:hypothetical protein KI387_012061, partial [Taxus chinensis]
NANSIDSMGAGSIDDVLQSMGRALFRMLPKLSPRTALFRLLSKLRALFRLLPKLYALSRMLVCTLFYFISTCSISSAY